MPEQEDIQLRIGSRLFHGWKSISVTRSMTTLSGGFSISSSQLNPFDPENQEILAGDNCELLLNGQVVITGYIDNRRIVYDPDSHELSVTGRDKLGDIVDCSVDGPNSGPGEWSNAGLLRITQDVVAPYGVEAFAETDLGRPFEHERAEIGATVFDHLAPLCKARAVLALSYGDGRLILSRAGVRRAVDALVLGENVKSGDAEDDRTNRFSVYTVKGQSTTNDWMGNGEYISPSGVAFDSAIKRYRPKTILAGTATDPGSCRDQAAWEAVVRAGQSTPLTYVVVGWSMSNGRLWPLNALIPVKDSFVGINRDMLIAQLAFTLDESGGQVTRISVVHPNSFALEPEKQNAGSVKPGWENLVK